MERFTIDSDCDLVHPLRGKPPLVGFAMEADYWHSDLLLRFDDGSLLHFTCNEHCLAPRFDCYTIAIQSASTCDIVFSPVSPPLEIDRAFALRRAEWLEATPELENTTVGNNAQTHHTGLSGAVPDGAVVSAVLQAGVLISSSDGSRIAIVASETTPLNVEFFTGEHDVQNLLNRHEIVRGE